METINCSGDTSIDIQIHFDEKTQSLKPAENTALKEQVAKEAVKYEDLTRINSDMNKMRHENVSCIRMIIEGMEEENVKLSADLRFQQEENHKVENYWKVKNQALLDCEEKLRSSSLEQESLKKQITETNEKLSAEQEKVELLILQNYELQDLAFNTDENKEKVKKVKKQEKKEQLEREKKANKELKEIEKEENEELKKGEKKEKKANKELKEREKKENEELKKGEKEKKTEGTHWRMMLPFYIFRRWWSASSSYVLSSRPFNL